jgi:imidazolonepropionase-like amidohydrolase
MVSSDAGVRMTPFDGIALSLQAFSFAMDASPAETLVAATATPARALGLEDEIGTIVAGKRADILVVEGDPLSDLGALRQVHLVLRDGAIAVQQGRLSLPVL